MSAPQSFSAWAAAAGLIPEGIELPVDSTAVAARAVLLRELPGPRSIYAFRLFLHLDDLAEQHSRETGAPRLAAVRATPIAGDRRALAGALDEVR